MSQQAPQPSVLPLPDAPYDTTRPLPANEQLALLFHMAGAAPNSEHARSGDTLTLRQAYTTCKGITRFHSKSFFFSTQFLPPEKRNAIYALYAFCRTSDDTVDMATSDPAQLLAAWVRQARQPEPPPDHAVLLAWHDTRARFGIPTELMDELLAGVAMDLTISRYATFADLWLYCYRVASVVGLLSMHILGSAPQAEPYAIKLGVALQMTNILRDVGEDASRGRVYLPEEDLARFGLCASDILAQQHDERVCNLMKFEIARTHRLYDESWPGIALLPADSRLGVGVAARVYRGILDKIVVNGYDVLHTRAHLTLSEKVALLPAIWKSVHTVGKP